MHVELTRSLAHSPRICVAGSWHRAAVIQMLCPPRTRKRRLPRRWGGWARALRSSLSRPRCKTPFSTTFRLRHRNGNRIFSSGHDLPWITPRNTHTRPRGHTQSERVQVGMQLERRTAKCNSEKIAKYISKAVRLPVTTPTQILNAVAGCYNGHGSVLISHCPPR